MTENPTERIVLVAAASLTRLKELREELQNSDSDPTQINSGDVLARAKNNLEFINSRIAPVIGDFIDCADLTIDLGPQSKDEGYIGHDSVLRFNSRYAEKQVEWSSADGARRIPLSDILLENYYLVDPNYRPTVVYLGNLTKDKIIHRFESYIGYFTKSQKGP